VHRFTPATRFLIAAMDGRRTVQQLWERTNRQLGEDAPTQDEVIRMLGQLHRPTCCKATPRPTAPSCSSAAGSRSARCGALLPQPDGHPRPPVGPGRAAQRLRPGSTLRVEPLGRRWPGWRWCCRPWRWCRRTGTTLTGNFSDRLLATNNLLLLWLVFP
jgi:putative peptide zinc metalloprotease protein